MGLHSVKLEDVLHTFIPGGLFAEADWITGIRWYIMEAECLVFGWWGLGVIWTSDGWLVHDTS
jgi:hypothetical protein